MKAEFEEKSYEVALIWELVFKKKLFAPGQVLENRLGFDVALWSNNRIFWKYFPDYYHKPWFWPWRYPEGIRFLEDWIVHMPKFKFNCFLQMKRPDFLKVKSAKEYSKWGKPYFRYMLSTHQQNVLENLANNTGKKALVAYACPTFYTYGDLNTFQEKEELVKQSNFCEASKLAGHLCYTYIQAGNVGKAHSETSEIESESFDLALERLSKMESSSEASNQDFLKTTASMLIEACSNIEGYDYFQQRVEKYQEKIGESEMLMSFAKINLFERIFNIGVLMG